MRVGVDIGGTKVVAGLVSDDGRVLDREDRLTPRRTAPAVEVEAIITDAVDALRGRHEVTSVGVAAAGFVDPDGERVRFAPHLSWRDEPLRRRLEERIGLPVRVVNDANAALWGETLYGAAREARDALMVTLGTGIGGAVLVEGRVRTGRNGMAGEFGHMRVVPDGRPCECGRTGCWEQYCSGKALARFAHDAGLGLTGSDLEQSARDGNIVALGAFKEVGRWLGVGVANLVAAFDPDLVLVGGGVSAAGDLLLEPARTEFSAVLVGRGHREEPMIRVAELGPLAGLIGAASAVHHGM